MAKTKLGSVKAVTEVLVTSANLASEVTGILPVANGGTGQSTFTDGQLLVGNTTGNTLSKATLTGTANQVGVTNGAGSVTLSTPQDIHTTATPQFARLGLNQAAPAKGLGVTGVAGENLVAGLSAAGTGVVLSLKSNDGTAEGAIRWLVSNAEYASAYASNGLNIDVAGNDLIFRRGGTEKARITTDGFSGEVDAGMTIRARVFS